MTGTDVPTYTREAPGMSAFALSDGVIYHTYSTYARGLDVLWGMYQWLDRAPNGRNETESWFRRHDEVPYEILDSGRFNFLHLNVKCKNCGTTNTITLENGELKKQRIETFLEKNKRKVDQRNNYASKWNNINRRMGGSKEPCVNAAKYTFNPLPIFILQEIYYWS